MCTSFKLDCLADEVSNMKNTFVFDVSLKNTWRQKEKLDKFPRQYSFRVDGNERSFILVQKFK